MDINFPLLLDGGLSTEMERMGYDLNHKLWTSRYLESDPNALLTVHTNYLNAGAKCITTFSYQATYQGYNDLGYTQQEATDLILKSVEIALQAVEQYCSENPFDARPLIAGSIGPYGAYQADGSEYRGNYSIGREELITFHSKKIEILDHSEVDLLAFETVPSYLEAEVIAQLTKSLKKPAWISFSCKDEKHINDGTPISECVKLFKSHPTIFAIGVNCTPPKYISSLINEIRSADRGIKIIIYPNSGEIYDGVSKKWKGLNDSDALQFMINEWLTCGADIIGGCCRLGADDIKKMSETISKI